MARSRRSSQPEPASGPGSLTVPREEFEAEIDDRIQRGGDLLERTNAIQSETDLDAVRSEFYTWNDYNKELLTRRVHHERVS
jgi:hypothetical protein